MGNFLDSSGLSRVWNKIASTYLPLSGGTLSGSNNILNLNSSSSNSWIYYKVSGSDAASTGYYSGLAYVANEIGGYARIGVNDSGVPQYWSSASSSTAKTLWHEGNDGTGSGLDADMTDGLHIHTGRNNEANKIVRTDSSGYIQAGWINTTSGNFTGTPGRIYASNDGYIRYMTPANFFSDLSNSGNNISITVGGQNRALTVGYASSATSASYLTVNYCRGGSGASNSGAWSSIKNGTSNAITGRAQFWTVYNDGGPTSYGEVLEILSCNTNHWQPQLWFEGGKGGHLYYRNKNYNDDTWGNWLTILDSSNYTSYTVKKDGTGASGTWGISISGNASTATSAGSASVASLLRGADNRSTNIDPSVYMSNGAASVYAEFSQSGGAASSYSGYGCRVTFTPWSDNSGGRPVQLEFNDQNVYIRGAASDSAWNSWRTIYDASNANKSDVSWTTAHLDTYGSIELRADGSSWNEGIRMHPATNGWSGIVFCEASNSGSSGTSSSTWSIHNNEGTFGMYRNGSEFNGVTAGLSCIGNSWYMKTGLTLTGNFSATGAVTAGSASDERLKENVQDLQLDFAKNFLMSIHPVTFTWNSLATSLYDQYCGSDIGLVAQEIEPYLPYAIKPIFEKYKRLEYHKLIPPIIRVVQDHEERIKNLEKTASTNDYLETGVKQPDEIMSTLNSIIKSYEAEIKELKERLEKLEKE